MLLFSLVLLLTMQFWIEVLRRGERGTTVLVVRALGELEGDWLRELRGGDGSEN